MKDSTTLIISLSTLFGTLALFLLLAFARFAYRKSLRGRAAPVDPNYEKTQVGEGREVMRKRWFGGAWGVTPVAEAGPGGTKQYLSGWFGLDPPSTAGWSRSDDNDEFSSTYGSSSTYTTPNNGDAASTASSTWRESHFSRASRAARRAVRLERKTATVEGKEGANGSGKKEKKKPRVSRTTELGMLEKEDGGAAGSDEEEAEKQEGQLLRPETKREKDGMTEVDLSEGRR
ncbi:hypothetical protein JCM6882_000743 [Rhodosporidiobolus microsporus]